MARRELTGVTKVRIHEFSGDDPAEVLMEVSHYIKSLGMFQTVSLRQWWDEEDGFMITLYHTNG